MTMTGTDDLSNSVREAGGVTIVSLAGKLRLGAGTESLREVMKRLVAEGRTAVVLELKDVTYIDSAGLGTLMACFTSVRSSGGTMKLLSLSRRVRDQLLMVKLMPVFEVFEEEAAAIASFARAAGS